MGGTAWRAPRQLSAGRNKNARVNPSAGAAGPEIGMAKINHSTRGEEWMKNAIAAPRDTSEYTRHTLK